MKKVLACFLVGIMLCGLVACDTSNESDTNTNTTTSNETTNNEAQEEVVKKGTVTGEVTYKYNDYVGSKPETGADVFLISKDVTSLPDGLAYGDTSELPEGCYATKVSGSGKYTFNNVPVGEYDLIFVSKNTNEKSSSVLGAYSWGVSAFLKFSAEGQERATNYAKLHKIRNMEITVTEGENTYSYDFGITYV